MDYHNQGCWQTDNSERDQKNRVIMKQELLQGYGDTNGDQYIFVQQWMTLELNMCEKSMQIIWQPYLKKYHHITEDWEGKKYSGVGLRWYYEKRTCRATMDGYILDLRNKFQHMQPKKPQS